jgi:CP family cyanate transporter-like MFS transporter
MPDPSDRKTPMPFALIGGLFLATLALRPQLLAIGPLLPLIRDDLGLPASLAGLLTTIPVLCMGLFAPVGPYVAARLGPRNAFGVCLCLVVGFGVARALAPAYPLVLLATFGLGLGVGVAGAIPSMIVSQRLTSRPALGTGAYAGGIVAGSTAAAAVAVPIAIDGDWRQSLLVISLVSIASIVALVLLVPGDRRGQTRAIVPHLPWRHATAWLLVVAFGLQSLMYYGVVAWLPNVFVERGWTPGDAGSLLAVTNAVGLVTTLGVPLAADRFGGRRRQLVASAIGSTGSMIAIALFPDLAYLWVAILGLALGSVFPLVLTLPLDVADEPGQVGSVASLMLLGGYAFSALGPFALGAARDATGNFEASLWILVVVGVGLVGCCYLISPSRLRRGIRRAYGSDGSMGRPAAP